MTILDTVKKWNLLTQGDRVLCALSGGPDSVCMTHALSALRADYGLTLAAAHFSHGLRPENAERERAFCTDLCRTLGVPLFCGTGDTPAYADAHGIGTEEAARILRYSFLERIASEWGANRIATAHNRGDQAETVLFRLIRGGGARGLSGIPVRRGIYIRPMLETGRDEIESYLAAHGLAYVVDGSNADTRYARNALRREVLPLLERIHPGAGANIVSAAGLLASDDDCLTEIAAALTDGATASASVLADAHPALAGRAVQRLWHAGGGTADLYRRQIESILALCSSRNPSGRINLPQGLAARRVYDRVTIGPAASEPTGEPEPRTLEPNTLELFGKWEVTLCAPAPSGLPSMPQAAIFPPCSVRTRRKGDLIKLPGGTQTLKKWMIDQKIPKEIRDTVPIVCDTEGVLAVPGAVRAFTESPGERVSIRFRRTDI